MIDFSSWLDLPLIWGVLIVLAVFLYVLLDGFDLGIGVLFPFAPSHRCRDRMMNSIAPFWDGNETWLVLSGGGLFAAFPSAYAVLMPALYLPVTFMLLGLIFRGVAFEFRFKTRFEKRWIWDASFHYGSLIAALMQGIILGNFVQGFEVVDGRFAGGPLDWANGFSLFCGVAVVFGYALIGATWTVMKTDRKTQRWARLAARYLLIFVIAFMALISMAMPFVDARVQSLWFSTPNLYYLAAVPLLTTAVTVQLVRHIRGRSEMAPFFYSVALFFLGMLGLVISLYPWIVPFQMTVWQAAAATTSQSVLLIGVALFLPLVLAYTAYSFYTFRGKASHESLY